MGKNKKVSNEFSAVKKTGGGLATRSVKRAFFDGVWKNFGFYILLGLQLVFILWLWNASGFDTWYDSSVIWLQMLVNVGIFFLGGSLLVLEIIGWVKLVNRIKKENSKYAFYSGSIAFLVFCVFAYIIYWSILFNTPTYCPTANGEWELIKGVCGDLNIRVRTRWYR